MSIDSILLKRRDGVLTITLNRPELRNAIGPGMPARLTEILKESQTDRRVRCLVITGAGDHFCSGGDIGNFRKTLDQSVEDRQAEFHHRLDHAALMIEAFLAFDRPIVARVRGSVAGAGLLFALIADVVHADENVGFLFAHRRMAVVPDGGVSWLLPRIVGLRQAKRLLLTAARVEAPEALALGLVTSLHSTVEELDAVCASTTQAIANAPQLATTLTKRLLAKSLATDASTQLADERDGIVACVGDSDFDEAVNAFLEKRLPRFAKFD